MATRARARVAVGAGAAGNGEASHPAGSSDPVRRAQLAELQRLRIVGSMLDVACERGIANVSVAHVVERSGVSRRTFYELFSDRDDCFLAALEQALAYTAERVLPAYESQTGWRERIRAGLVATLALFDEQPQLARVLVCESLSGGPAANARRAQVIELLIEAVEAGSAQARKPAASLPLLAEGVVGGVLTVLQRRLVDPAGPALLEHANSLMGMIVLPYLGPAAAQRELGLAVKPPPPGSLSAPMVRDPFKEAGMRLTYRTVRVLLAVGELAEASNRTVGRSAGIDDQGQISKLLARLQRVGLIENTFGGSARGGPNAWALTEKGRRLTDSIRAHSGVAD